jgi:predicted site-specific integrase-resolvase
VTSLKSQHVGSQQNSRAPRCSHAQTLRNWSDKGILSIRKTPGRFHYSIPVGKQDDSVENVIYARVSSAKQKADLVRQVDFLRHRFPNHKVVTDVGSGVNFKRKAYSAF